MPPASCATLETTAALYRLDSKPVMSLVHEAYYRNSVPEFGEAAMQPSCYCDYCTASFADYLGKNGWDPSTPAPRDASDPALWQALAESPRPGNSRLSDQCGHRRQSRDAHLVHPELNGLLSGLVAAGLYRDRLVAHERGGGFSPRGYVPLEFDHRYQCYVFDYAKDVMRSSGNFKTLNVANGQAFNSWAGYKLPEK